jgi:hypothetical protein
VAALMERLGFGGREMTASGHSKDFVLKVVQPSLVGLMERVRLDAGAALRDGFCDG